MRHQKAFRKFSRTPAHRKAMFRNMATSLVIHEHIETTLPKAKELKRVADKLVTLGKKNTLHARRQAMGFLQPINRKAEGNANKLTAVHKLFEEIAPRFTERNGGYTRVLRTRKRDGDNAQLAIIQFVEEETVSKTPKRKKRNVKRSASAESAKKVEKKQEEATE
jgi:large subunit ribosomal protein L17